ncbi:solute carrier family 25 member 44 isoform X1 [Gallus gallus]|uniref:solute carrier family 25 member 44 isoform X1 n=1 Tax=Gallus gallus TaxID=9031 RepID=UPI001AE816EF|nr:solute carrier family 25 member 44 isoform X1 [Gallus gallus]
MEDKRNIPIIEWEHLDKRRFYVLGICMTMMIRVSVYPFTLIRTRLQVQKGKSLYNGTFDAFVKILRTEGAAGLYRGFLVNTFTLISGQCYVTTYELTRKYVARYNNNNAVKSLVAGGSASLVAQSITVPIDVVSQHLMMQRKGESMGRFTVRGRDGRRVVVFGQTKDIIVQIFRADGFRGFYRGYVASLLTYIPNSAVWWPFYHFYAALQPDPQGLPTPPPSGHLGATRRRHGVHAHQPHGCHQSSGSGGRQKLHRAHLQAADGGGGAVGADQRPFRPHHLRHPVHHRHRGGLRDAEEAEPPPGADGLPALVAPGGAHRLQHRPQRLELRGRRFRSASGLSQRPPVRRRTRFTPRAAAPRRLREMGGRRDGICGPGSGICGPGSGICGPGSGI